MQKIFLLILCVFWFFFPAMYSLGVSLAAIELLTISFSFGFLLLENKCHFSNLVVLMFVLVCIDKVNDLSSDFTLSNIGPIFYTLAITMVFANLGKYKNMLISFMRRMAFFAVIIDISIYYSAGIDLSKIDRDVSVLLMFFFILTYYYGNKKLLLPFFIIVLFIEIFILEARTMILSFSAFLLLDWFLKRIESIRFRNFIFFFSVVVSFGIIFYAIRIEYIGGSWNNTSELFTGRGYIWGAAMQEIFLNGSLRGLLFGLPTTPEYLTKIFAGTFTGWLKETTEEILIKGHFHSTIVYYIFNTGIVGTFLLFYICYKAMKKMGFSRESYCLFIAIFITSIFNGRSLTGYYVISTLFMFTLLVQLPESACKTIKRKGNGKR